MKSLPEFVSICRFDDQGSGVSIGSTRELGLHESFTVTVWIKLDRYSLCHDNCIIGQPHGVNGSCLHLIVRQGRPYMGFFNADVASHHHLALDVWYHLVFVYDLAAQSQSIYVDGQLSVTAVSRRPLQGDQAVLLSQCGVGANNGLDGSMSSLWIYRRALPAAEIAQFMFCGVPGGLVWAEDKSGVVTDITPAQLAGRLVGGSEVVVTKPTADAPCPFLSCLFGDQGSGVAIGSTRELGLHESFTVSVWIKLDRCNITHDNTIIGQQHAVTGECLHLIIRRGRPYMGFFNADLTTKQPQLTVGVWYHLAFVYDMAALTQTIYVDGQLAAAVGSRHPLQGDQPVLLSQFGVGINDGLDGSMSSLRIYRRALPPAEIAQIKLCGVPSGLVWAEDKSGVMTDITPTQLLERLVPGRFPSKNVAPLPRIGLPDVPCPLSCSFDDKCSGLSIGSTRELGLHESFTVMVWIKLNCYSRYHDNSIIGQVHGVNGGCLHLILRRGRPHMGFYNSDVASPTQLTVGVWCHLAFVYDMATQTQSIYVDGELSGVNSSGPLQGDQAVLLSQFGMGGVNNGLDGSMSSLRIYRRALPVAEIAQIAPLGMPSGLVWAEDQTGVMTDITPPQLTARLVPDNVPTKLAVSLPRTAVELAKIDDRCPLSCCFNDQVSGLSIGSTAELGFHGSFSVAVWIKLDCYSLRDDNSIIAQPNGVTMGCLHLIVRRGRPYMGFYNADISSPQQLSVGVWYHLAFVYDMEAQAQGIYVDGQLTAVKNSRPLQGDQPVLLSQYGVGVNNGLDGNMSSLRIYRRALPPTEIAQIMLLGVPSGLVWAEDKSGVMTDITPAQLVWRLVSDGALHQHIRSLPAPADPSVASLSDALAEVSIGKRRKLTFSQSPQQRPSRSIAFCIAAAKQLTVEQACQILGRMGLENRIDEFRSKAASVARRVVVEEDEEEEEC